jgi:hypothetical protein
VASSSFLPLVHPGGDSATEKKRKDLLLPPPPPPSVIACIALTTNDILFCVWGRERERERESSRTGALHWLTLLLQTASSFAANEVEDENDDEMQILTLAHKSNVASSVSTPSFIRWGKKFPFCVPL